MKSLRGKEPGPTKQAIENLLARAKNERQRYSIMQTIFFISAKYIRDEFGTDEAIRLLEIEIATVKREPFVPRHPDIGPPP